MTLALFSFVTIHASDGRMDGRTELRQQYCALHYMQSHGKNLDPVRFEPVSGRPIVEPHLRHSLHAQSDMQITIERCRVE